MNWKIILTILCSGLLILCLTGCSDDEETDTAQQSQTQEQPQTSNKGPFNTPQYNQADLATFTYPIRDLDNPLVTLKTSYGDMILELYHNVAPIHVDSFIARTSEGFYDSLLFFRVVENFMIQTGDPNNNGTGSAGYLLPAEFSNLPHIEGTLSMARGRSENSAGTQFFIVLARTQSAENLDGKYTIFGHLIKGYDVLHKIGSVEVGPQPNREVSRPTEPVYLYQAYLSDLQGNPLN